MSYDLTAIASQVRERVAYLLSEATPSLAPGQPFVPIDDDEDNFCALEDITEPARLRMFEVVALSPKAVMPWGSAYASYEHGFAIRLGYSLQRREEIDGTSYKVQDLKDHDFKQIDWLLQAGAPWSEIDGDHPEIGGVRLALLGDVVDEADGRVRAIRYAIIFEQEN